MNKATVKILLEFFELTLILTGILFVCYMALGQILEVNGDSMYPLIHDKERILAEKFSPKMSRFQRGEVVVFTSVENKDALIIKRIIGLPGDKIAINSGNVFVNDKLLTEKYVYNGEKTEGGKFLQEAKTYTVPGDSYFMMGDNRAKSIDSRAWGPLPMKNMLGRAILIYKPISQFRFLIK
jgi:signal peptidase I